MRVYVGVLQELAEVWHKATRSIASNPALTFLQNQNQLVWTKYWLND